MISRGYSLDQRQHDRHVIAIVLAGVVLMLDSCAPRKYVAVAIPDEEACEKHLRYVWRLASQYRLEHGEWPHNPVGPNGNVHSWRVLLLPYCLSSFSSAEAKARIDYRFDQPWNSPHNLNAVSSVMASLCCVCNSESTLKAYPFVSYLWLSRPLPADAEIGSSEPLPNDAVLIVESALCGVEFAEPKDVDASDLLECSSPFGRGRLNSLHPHVVNAIRVDGKVINIPKAITKEEVLKLLNGSP